MIRRNGEDYTIEELVSSIESANATLDMLEDGCDIKFTRNQVKKLLVEGTDFFIEKLRMEGKSGLGIDLVIADILIRNACLGYRKYHLGISGGGRLKLFRSAIERIMELIKLFMEQNKKEENHG